MQLMAGASQLAAFGISVRPLKYGVGARACKFLVCRLWQFQCSITRDYNSSSAGWILHS